MRHGWILLAMAAGCGGTDGPLLFTDGGGGAASVGGAGGGAPTGAGGAGGAASGCTVAADCTGAHDEACSAWQCDSGACHLLAYPVTSLPDDMPGDCRVPSCDGFGGREQAIDDDDLPAAPECKVGKCNAGFPVFVPALENAPCAEHFFCDGAGACVECTGAGQCFPGSECIDHVCQPQ